MPLFGAKKDVKEELREQNKVLRGAQRDLERERTQMERDKKKLEIEIKKAAKDGNKQACAILAKQLIQLRKQETRTLAASSKITGVKTHTQIMASNIKLGEAMKKTTDTMTTMNKIQDPMKMAKTMQEFEKQTMKMDLTDEMINDTLDGVLDGSDDEAESDNVVNQVLEEIGIEINGKLINAPTPDKAGPSRASVQADNEVSDAEIQNMLARLNA